MIRAYLTTALCMLILGMVGLATAGDMTPSTLNVVFYLAFLPSVAAGMLVFFSGSLAKTAPQQKPAEKPRAASRPYPARER